jgi:Tfp pilus assembly protein PilN
MAASNDVKSAHKVRTELLSFIGAAENATPEAFLEQYNRLLKTLQHDLSEMEPTPIVSLANEAVVERCRQDRTPRASDRASATVKVA